MHETPAIIFDVDGVLVDSYDAHFESYRRLGTEFGLEMPREEFAAYFGRTTRETIQDVWAAARLTDDQVATMDSRKEAIYRDILTESFPHMEGANSLIQALDTAGFLIAVGSSGPAENVDLVIDQISAGHRIGVRVTGQDVRRGKPNPEVFLIAARRLSVPSNHCVVIEDAAAGVAAARAAGMTSIGLVSTGRTRSELSLADLVVNSLAELSPRVIEELVGPLQSP